MSPPRLVRLLGHGISYSASPAMQQAAFRARGLDWSYRILDVPPEGLAEAVRSLRAQEVAGANVTIPHKVHVMAHLDDQDSTVLNAGAVNTICNRDGRLLGSNTDVAGIRSAVDHVGVRPEDCRAVVLGAGGSARACGAALAGAELTFVARRPRLATGLPGSVLAWDDPSWPALAAAAGLLVNATPLGRGGEMPLAPDLLPRAGAVVDLVYAAGGTPLTRAAAARGLRHADGWHVLLFQGAASFEAWTGLDAPLAAMRKALAG